MNFKMNYFRMLCFLLLILPLSAIAEDSGNRENLEAMMDRLLAGDRRVIPALVVQREQALSLFQQRISPNVQELNPLLLQLGAENYRDRIQAEQALSKMGTGIRERVIAFQQQHASDPEINKRCRRVLNNLVDATDPAVDVSVVEFLVALKDPNPEIILAEKDRYLRIFETKDRAFFQNGVTKVSLEDFSIFVRQYLSIPGVQDEFMSWLLRDSAKERTLGTVRFLLQSDFETHYPLVMKKNRYSHEINRLVENEFSGNLGEKEHLFKLKALYDEPRHPKEMEFDPQKPITPEIAYQIMNREGMNRLDPSYYDMLFEKLAPMPREELTRRMQENPLQGFFLQQLAIRRPDLKAELTELILTKIKGIDYLWLWDVYLMVLVNDLAYETEAGELDEEWLRMLEAREGSLSVLSWRVDDLKLSPAMVLTAFRKYEQKTKERFDQCAEAFAYILENGGPQVREESVEFLLKICEAEELHFQNFNKIWTALVLHPDTEIPGLPEKKLQLMGALRSKKDNHFLSQAMKSSTYTERDKHLLAFYKQNQSLLDQKFSEVPLSESALQTACLLTKSPQLPEATRLILKTALQNYLQSDPETPQNVKACLIAGMNLGGIPHPVWLEALLDLMNNGNEDPFSFPIWQLDHRYRSFLPLLKQRMEKPEAQRVPLLCLGLMIDPDDPAWQPIVDEQLQHRGESPEIAKLIKALRIVNKEPDLSQLPAERLSVLFDVSGKEAYQKTSDLFHQLSRPINKHTALQLLQPELKTLFGQNFSIHGLDKLYFQAPDCWEIAGETILEVMESGDVDAAGKAASNFTSIGQVPESAAPRLGALLQNSATPQRTKDSLLWAIGRMGPGASGICETVREVSAQNDRMKLRKAFALAAISTDQEERLQNLTFLQEQHLKDPDQYTLRQIGLIQGLETERLTYFQDRLAEAFAGKNNKTKSYHLNEIIYRLTNFSDPEIAVQSYIEILTQLAAPDFLQPELYPIADPVFQRLVTFYPHRLEEFKPFIEALPPQCKASWRYRLLKERMPSEAD